MQLVRHALLFVCGMAGFLLLFAACSKEDKTTKLNAHVQGSTKQTTVVESPESKGKWRAVIIGISDKQSNKETDYELPIGFQTAVPATNISINVENFLPHFIMQGTVLTSQSNEQKNPAVKLTVFEGKKEIYTGWLFALYPTTHAFQHPQYGFTLVGYVAAR